MRHAPLEPCVALRTAGSNGDVSANRRTVGPERWGSAVKSNATAAHHVGLAASSEDAAVGQSPNLRASMVWSIAQMGVQSAPSRHETDEQSDQARDFPLRLMQELTHRGLETEQSGLISSRLTEMLLELVVQRSSDIEDLPNYHDIQHRFIESVLRDPQLTEADILRGGQLFGIDFTRPRAVILVGAANYILGDLATVAIRSASRTT